MKKIISLLLAGVMLICSLSGCGEAAVTEGDPLPLTKIDILNSKIDANASDYYLQLAKFATDDVIANFWDFEENHMKRYHSGVPVTRDVDSRGATWETAQCVYGIYDMWVVTGDEYYENLLSGEAKFFRDNFTAEELVIAGGNTNWATDDCFWNCMLYLIFYEVTGDKWFIDVTSGLLDSCNERWGDDVAGGGMWYSDDRTAKSLYEVGAAISWFRLWEITGEQRYYDLAYASYNWMYTCLGSNRDDGLYFCSANEYGPVGGASSIAEAGSASFLTANMGMAALAVMFYEATGEQQYLDRAYAVCDGLPLYYDDEGVLLDDRDAWTNGAFATYFASRVLTLPDVNEQTLALCKATATSVVYNDRTPDGYYGGTWKGPSEGSLSIWYCGGSVATQAATTGTAVSMVTSMAVYEAGIKNFVR